MTRNALGSERGLTMVMVMLLMTAMLLGALGWAHYKAPAHLVTPYFVASGTGQVIAQLPVEPASAELRQLATAEATP